MFSGLSTKEFLAILDKGSAKDTDYQAGYAQAILDLLEEGSIDMDVATAKLNKTEEEIEALMA